MRPVKQSMKTLGDTKMSQDLRQANIRDKTQAGRPPPKFIELLNAIL